MAKFLGYEDPRDTWKATGYVFDPCRVVLRAPQGGRVCLEEMAALGLDAEMGLGDCVVLLLPPSISWQEVEWMQDVLRAIPPRGCLSPMTEPERQPLAEKRMDVRQAALGRLDTVPLKEAAGRIAGVCAGCYPPGVPLVVPGEVLTEETVRRLTDAGPRGRFGTENDEREETIGCADVSCLIWTEP